MGVPTSNPSASVVASRLLSLSHGGSRLQACVPVNKAEAALSFLIWLRSHMVLLLHSSNRSGSRAHSDSSRGDRDQPLGERSVRSHWRKAYKIGDVLFWKCNLPRELWWQSLEIQVLRACASAAPCAHLPRTKGFLLTKSLSVWCATSFLIIFIQFVAGCFWDITETGPGSSSQFELVWWAYSGQAGVWGGVFL